MGDIKQSTGFVSPVARSTVIAGIAWLGDQISYHENEKRGDTFPITWADDDNQYTSAGDPACGEKKDGLDFERFSGDAPNYRIDKINEMFGYCGSGGNGPKPTGMICVGGVLYMAFQNLTRTGGDYDHGYDAQIVYSKDYGRTWLPDVKPTDKPMFPGRVFGAPAFVNFGKDNAGAKDQYVYAISGEGWDNGDNCRLGRVPSNRIMDVAAWQWVGGFNADSDPIWTSHMNDAAVLLRHPGYLGCIDMVYLSSIKRYLLLSWHHKIKGNFDAGSELVMYDAPQPWGPFTLVHHEDPWETQEMNPYNPRVPLKWFDMDRLEGWMLFSGSWRNGGQTPFYRAHIRKFRIITR